MSSGNGWLGTLPPNIKAKAFLRTDAYGTYANNTLSLALKLRLALVCVTLVPLKLLASLFCVVSYYLFISVGNAVLKEPYKAKYMAFWGRFWTRMVLYSLGFWTIKWVYVSPDGTTSSKPPAGFKERRFGGYVSNHCSWVDIVLYMSRLFPSFVAKKEVSKLPLIGAISKAMQCLFVDREARLAAAAAEGGKAAAEGGKAAADAAAAGGGQGMAQLVKERMERKYELGSAELPMMLFPEGTTTNNKYIMPFKRGAFVAGVPVQPLVLKYRGSSRFSPTWDAMPGPHHIFLTMTELSYGVTVHMLPLYEPSPEEKEDPALYAENVRQMMVKYTKIPSIEDTFADKLEFFKYVTGRMADEKRQGKGKQAAQRPAASGKSEDAASAGRNGGVTVHAKAL